MIYGWEFVALYFISVVIVPLIFMMVWIANDMADIKLSSGDDLACALLFCLFWPFVMPLVIRAEIIRASRKRAIERCKGIISMHNMERFSQHDRTCMIDMEEKELKFLLKHHRKSNIQLPKHLLEMVRDELMNRSAEAELLGKKDE